MIAPLRTRHHRWWLLLAIALPLLILLALAARQPVPTVDELPGAEVAEEALPWQLRAPAVDFRRVADGGGASE